MQLEAAIGLFFSEFSKFETYSVGLVLRALSKDPVVVEQAEKLLALEARLTLLERLAFSRNTRSGVMAELTGLVARSQKLRQQREELARAVAVDSENPQRTPWLYSLPQIEAYLTETIDLQQQMQEFAKTLSLD